ncbi:hypothetical protein [Pantoea allii]|uniref:Uncharacterized protein n=1 Tax=Pantoea allii TaxID=574096 RepID=A0ABS6V8J5_9GAMM|nr:hypothetical protein [Pantoea allii]MBW1212748.1 hypothetical protein [Pantoea allii]MBW1254541.1 hypothetical protein [Pantoea allii]MBW1255614.1 hypothetical protein [Pantoea allii]MBW1263482.1 hypothetical protein [Pantoea allii]MBW1264691.1 hypothetical protein [Pantoea allii]
MGIESDYIGDDAWRNLVDSFSGAYPDEDVKALARKMNGMSDIAIVVNGKIGLKGGLEWSERKIAMLENIRPIDCLNDDVLLKRLKEYLIELPC